MQLSLFSQVESVYAEAAGSVSNAALYQRVAEKAGLTQFGGSLTTGVGCEELGRPWVSTECMWEYARGGAERFRQYKGFALNPDFLNVA
ncbi:MAG: hypothetical protein AWU57_47 [Marinobacter sp. T13-3]|nr:MAG: hypothetical protein AWU57_47 [Marinobacter sp. T13-3]